MCDDPADLSWLNRSQSSRRYGASCQYQAPCFEWTGLRPYSEPSSAAGSAFVRRAVPAGRTHHAAALAQNLDSGERDVMVLFGGYSADCVDFCNDTWHYSVPNNLWVKPLLAPLNGTSWPTNGSSPSRRWKHAMVDYRDSVFLFGGVAVPRQAPADGSAGDANEVYDSNAYDGSSPLFFGDLWSYNVSARVNTWVRLVPTCPSCDNSSLDPSGPRPRYGASLINYGDLLYLFGGYAYGGASRFSVIYPSFPRNLTQLPPSLYAKYYLNDLWLYSVLNNTWAQARPAAAGAGAAAHPARRWRPPPSPCPRPGRATARRWR